MDDQMMPVQQHSLAAATASWAGVDSDETHNVRCVAMVCMAKKWLHGRTGVLAQVHVHFLR